jgi:hypothetical protein
MENCVKALFSETKNFINDLMVLFSSPCQRQSELLPSLGIRRLLTFHILIFSSETSQPNELKLEKEASMEGPL